MKKVPFDNNVVIKIPKKEYDSGSSRRPDTLEVFTQFGVPIHIDPDSSWGWTLDDRGSDVTLTYSFKKSTDATLFALKWCS